MAKSDSVTSPWAKAFCSFIQFTSIQNNKIKFKSINHTILQYWETISVQKNSFWSWNGGKSEKSDSVTFKLDQFLYLTSWKLWSKKSKRFSFLSSNIRVCYRKIATIYTYLAKVALLSLIFGKIHEMSHYHYVTLLKRYSQIF